MIEILRCLIYYLNIFMNFNEEKIIVNLYGEFKRFYL